MNHAAAARPLALARMALAAIVTAVLMVTGLAATPAQALPAASVTVTITSKAGTGVTGLVVKAESRNGDERIDAVAQTGGRYLAEGLDPDTDYTFSYYAAGTTLPAQYYGNTSNFDDAEFTAFPAGPSSLSFSTFTGASISGTVTGDKKKPRANIYVQVYSFDGADWVYAADAITNAKGKYSVTNLDADRYKVRFVSVYDDLDPQAPPTTAYLSEWYGDKYSLETATVVTLGAGQKFTANATLARGGAITGIVNDPYAQEHCGCSVTTIAEILPIAYRLLGTPADNFAAGIDRSSAVSGVYYSKPWLTGDDGKYSFTGLQPGYYVVEFTDFYNDYPDQFLGGGSSWKSGTKLVVTAGKTTKAPVGNLAYIDDVPAISLNVNMQDFDTNVPIESVEVSVESADGGWVERSSSTNSDGSTRFERLGTGTYTLTGIADGYQPFTKQVTLGSVSKTEWLMMKSLDDPFEFTSTSIDGDATVGEVLSAEAGTTYDSIGTTVDRAYQWYRDGLPIFGARAQQYRVQSADTGMELSVRVTANAPGADEISVILSTLTVGTGDKPHVVKNPSISFSGTAAKIGTVLKANPGTWDVAGASFTYQWFSNEAPVGSGASTYTLTAADAGHLIGVQVTALKAGRAPSDAATAWPPVRAADVKVAVKKAASITSAVVDEFTTYTLTLPTLATAGYEFALQWRVNGVVVGNSATVQVNTEDADDSITVDILGTRAASSDFSQQLVARKGVAPTPGTQPFVATGPGFSWVVSDPDASVVPGMTLRATGAQFSYLDSDEEATSFAYQWLREGAVITGATKPTYTIVAADLGKHLTVRVTAINPRYLDGVIVAPAGLVALDPTLTETPATVALRGTAAPTTTVASTVGAWPIAGVKTTYEWALCTSDCSSNSAFAAIPGATKASYVPTAAQAGSLLLLRVTGTKAGFEPAVVVAGPMVVKDADVITPLTAPTISGLVGGNAKIGVKLTAKAGAVDIAGVSTAALSWQTCDDSFSGCGVDENWTQVATGATFTPTSANYAPAGNLRVVAAVSKAGYTSIVNTSEWAAVVRGSLAVTKAPAISRSGDVFTVTSGTYSQPFAVTYAWHSGSDLVDSDASYTLDGADAGKFVGVTVTAEAAGYEPVVTVITAQKGAAPTVGTPVVIGDRTFGGSMTVGNPFVYSDIVYVPKLGYQWYAGGKAITGATKQSLATSTALLNKQITVKVTSLEPGYATASYTTPASTIQLANAPAPTSAPSFTVTGGVLRPGAKASLNPLGWTVPKVTVSYKWQTRVDGGAWVTVPKATKSSYTVVAADAGKDLRLVISATKPGYDFAVIEGAGESVYFTAPLAFTTTPVVSGSGAVGTTLTSTAGALSVSGAKFSYQWFREGVALPAATTSTLVVQEPFVGNELTVTVTATKAGYAPISFTPNMVVGTWGAAPTATGKNLPKIIGSAAVGQTLSATTGVWSLDGLTFSYDWKVGGVSTGTTTPTYVVTAPGVVTVTVTATRAGYYGGTATTAGVTAN